MDFKSRGKKGQAAIEFLMTYGWMLLVVLIVGALIFSFVDFGSLLPNNLDLNNGFRQLAPDMITAYESSDEVSFAVTYISASLGQVTWDNVNMSITGDVYTCSIDSVTNSDTGQQASATGETVNFVNGQVGVFVFDCSVGNDLVAGDVIEGDVVIQYSDPKVSSLILTSSGSIRVGIED